MMAVSQASRSPVPLSTLLGDSAQVRDVEITGVQLDSRAVGPGDLFIALPGEIHDGRQFIEQAVAAGAAAVVAEAPVSGFVDEVSVPLVELPELAREAGEIAARFFGHPSRELYTVGVTGTNGKTTTTRLVSQLARALGHSCGVVGTLGATLGDEVIEAGNTTPDPVSLQRQLHLWREQGVWAVGLEVSSHALVQGRVSGVDFNTAVFTNLSHDHLDYHGSFESYGRAKTRLFQWPGLGAAIINLDDEFAPAVLRAAAAVPQCLTYSLRADTEADIRFEQLRYHAAGVDGLLVTPWGRAVFRSPLQGHFNLSNLAAAVAVLACAGMTLADVAAAVSTLRPIPGRMQSVDNELGLQVIVDYAHTPDALEQAIRAIRPHVAGRLITVFGCGGDRDREKRPVMGRIASEGSDRVIVTSDNPRGEHPLAIIRDIEAGCVGDCEIEVDRAAAIARALAEAETDDCVLIAGKGHEDYQLVDGEKLPFSDVEHARASLARLHQQRRTQA